MMENILKITALYSMAFIFMAVSCEKDEDDAEPVIANSIMEGHLYKSCDKSEPYANLVLYFYSIKHTIITYEEKYLGTTTTDSEGYYRFDTGECYSNRTIEVRDADDELVFEGGCPGTGYIPLDGVSKPTTSHYVKLKLDTNFYAGDTLFIGMNRNPHLETFLVGPLQNNYSFKFDSVKLPRPSGGYITGTIGRIYSGRVYWGIGQAAYQCIKYNPSCQVDPYIVNFNSITCMPSDTIIIDLTKI